VSGVVALLLERRPDADPEAIRKALQTTAKDLGSKGYDDQFGWGLVDPFAAIQAIETNVPNANASATATAAPTPAPSLPPRPGIDC